MGLAELSAILNGKNGGSGNGKGKREGCSLLEDESGDILPAPAMAGEDAEGRAEECVERREEAEMEGAETAGWGGSELAVDWPLTGVTELDSAAPAPKDAGVAGSTGRADPPASAVLACTAEGVLAGALNCENTCLSESAMALRSSIIIIKSSRKTYASEAGDLDGRGLKEGVGTLSAFTLGWFCGGGACETDC